MLPSIKVWGLTPVFARRVVLAGTIWAVSACGPVSRGDQAGAEILTVVLPRPVASGSTLEPTVVIDPDDPDRIVVVA